MENDPIAPEEILLTPKEAAKRLRVSEFTILDWLRDGTVRGVKVGGGVKGRWRVRASDLPRAIRPPERLPQLSPEELEETAAALQVALGSTVVIQDLESLKSIVQGIDHPTQKWWQLLARGIRALEKNGENEK